MGSSSGNGGPSGSSSYEAHPGQAPPPALPSLARSLQALSTPRPPDNVAPGLLEQLPPEGNF